LKMWRHYLLSRRLILMNDHSGLRYLFNHPSLNVRKDIWLDTISEFHFKIMYVKGKERRVTGNLSRRVQVNHILVMSSYGTDLQGYILWEGKNDDRYK